MRDIESEIKEIRLAAERARITKTKADLQRDNARATVDKIVGRLRTEFEVNSLAEANDLLNRLDQELRNKVDSIKEELSAFD